MGPSVIADLDTLLIALYVELTDRIIPARSPGRCRGPGRPATVTDAELVCLAVAQVLFRFNDEHHWLRAAPSRVGHLFPRLLSQPEYNRRLRKAADLLEATCAGWPTPPRPPPSCCGWWTAPPCPAGPPRPPRGGRTCSATPATAATPLTTVSTGAPTCCCLSPARAPPPGSAWPTPNWPASARRCCGCWTPRPTPRSPAPCWSATKALPATRSRPPWPAST